MADIKKLEEKALNILIENKDIYFMYDLAEKMDIARSTFYYNQLDKLDSIKNALLHNKRILKRGLRAKWYNSDNATTQVALYKLLADDDELARLNNNIDFNVTGNNLKVVVADKKSKDAIEDI